MDGDRFVQSRRLNVMRDSAYTEWKLIRGVLTVNGYIRECGGKRPSAQLYRSGYAGMIGD
jgi:hypothetical protein